MRRPCLTCGTPSPGPYCPNHDRTNAKKAARKRAHGTGRKHWRKLRRAVLERDGWFCRLRLPGCTLVATAVHLDPGLEGNHDVATVNDCVSACAPCHGRVDAPRASR